MELVSELDWQSILYKRVTAILLGISSILTAIGVFIIHSDLNPDALSRTKYELISIAGAVSAIGFLALLTCMGFFWLKCDTSSKLNRTIWFLLLLLGFSYGTQVAYYAIAYLPQVVKRLRNPDAEGLYVEPSSPEDDPKRLGPFRRSLLIVWLVPLAAMFAIFVLPKTTEGPTAVVTLAFIACSAIVIIESIIHFVLSFYRSGMRG